MEEARAGHDRAVTNLGVGSTTKHGQETGRAGPPGEGAASSSGRQEATMMRVIRGRGFY
jgi:hypothetical protein